jgi:hypothetical protein
MTGRVGENNGAKREKVSEFMGFLETSKSAGIRMNPRKHARVGEKNQLDEGLVFGIGGDVGN